MHNEAINPAKDINPEEALEKALDLKIVAALEARPKVTVPAGFAARVSGQLPVRGTVREVAIRRTLILRPTHYGQWAMAASLVVLAIALVALLASNFGDTPAGLTLEWIVYAQLLALAAWLGLRRVNIFMGLWPHRSGR